ncbi:phosphatase [Streptomyces sp. PRh5]|nr:phosphatase [Streptomyces sp. PRh5]
MRHVLAHTDRTLDDTCQAVLDSVSPGARRDDIALLLARTRALDPARIARWEVPADPAAFPGISTAAARTLDTWGLGDLACVTELLLSELVTNAIRYANGPIQVRLLLAQEWGTRYTGNGKTSWAEQSLQPLMW